MSLEREQIKALQRRLKENFRTLRKEIARELSESDETPYIELAGQVHDAGDASVAELLKDLNLASVDRHLAELRAIDAALMRIAEGSYGVCVDCLEPIAFARLDAQPTAARCRSCQTRWEKTVSTGNRLGTRL